ncbi:MAG: hypothetical protein ACOYN4_21555, partial [Bacteroidales bacterium]
MIPTRILGLGFPAARLIPDRRFRVHLKEIVAIFFFLFFLFSIPNNAKAQDPADDYEEISVFLMVQGIGGYEVTALYKDEVIFLPVAEMF